MLRYKLSSFMMKIVKNDKGKSFLRNVLKRILFGYYRRNCSSYTIIPFGNYCLPRAITTFNLLKPIRKYGEKTCPFDQVVSAFNINTELLDNGFANFFDGLQYDKARQFYVNSRLKMSFIHDGMYSREIFIEKYRNRIKNLYEYLNDSAKHIYFLTASFSDIDNAQVERFRRVVNKFRDESRWDLIIINQSKQVPDIRGDNIYVIDMHDDDCFARMNYKNNWFKELKRQRMAAARKFNQKIICDLRRIITER